MEDHDIRAALDRRWAASDASAADLWITELIISYEFRDGKVARETQYFGDPFEPGPSRAQWVERMR